MFLLQKPLKKITILFSKLSSRRTHSSTSLHILKIKSLATKVPRAWYDRLSNFLLKNDFKRGQVDTTLSKKTLEKDILIVQIYVDDIIFGSTNASLCKEFSKLMQEEFEMSMMGELKFFL